MKTSRIGWLVAVVAAAALLAAWALTRPRADGASGTPAHAAGAASAGAGAPVSVSTVRAAQRDVEVVVEATGTVTALNSVDVRPQVASIIREVHLREGQFVKAGQLLFTLDARPDEVNLAKARAQLQRDQAALADAERQYARSRELLAQNFVSQGAVDTARTQVETQQAVVAADRAAIRAAEVGLSYTRIVAPSAGRAGAIAVFPGSSVQPGSSTLVTITQLDPIAVAFALPQRELVDALALLRAGGGRVEAALPEGRGRAVGRLDFVDSAVDAASGTVKVKARFDNADATLWPGAFVTVRMAVRTLKDAVVVPQAAVIHGPRGDFVYAVDASEHAVQRPVEVRHAEGVDAAVSGIAAGERIVVDGRQNLRPGSRVVERGAAAQAAAKRATASTSRSDA